MSDQDLNDRSSVAVGTPTQPVPVDVSNPLSEPYRTGSYPIFDIPSGKPDHFRTTTELVPNPYRASGSHQLNADQLSQMLSKLVSVYAMRDLFLVDLRQETHGFIDGNAVSWYADNDFGNVGLAQAQIEREERARLDGLPGETTQIFTVKTDPSDNRQQQRILPVSYETITVTSSATEQALFDNAVIGECTVHYVRIPVTDHCAPTPAALAVFSELTASCDPTSAWMHFHCHGGDGRTTTFLALYDMVCWKRSSTDPLPALEVFARRQFGLPPNYCLDPDGCGDQNAAPTGAWNHPLAVKRWEVLGAFRDKLADPPA